MKARTSLNLGRIGLFTLELFALERGNFSPWIYIGENDVSTFYSAPHKKWRGIMLYSPNRLSVRPSVHPSIHPSSFPDSNLSGFWPIFFKLCMDMDIGEECFGIANGRNSFINNRIMILDWCKNVFFFKIFRTKGWILIKFCICIDIYKIYVVPNAR